MKHNLEVFLKQSNSERLDANRDLKMTVERLAVTHGPDAVLHNLMYCKLFVPNFDEVYDGHCG